uniref:Uncharacterized protein n=1 Tax=Brassica oleracea var. oleracea TaxID=109376 RepID=A0A0D3E978_BRAOL
MGLDYSYSLASESEDLFGHSVDSGFSETSDLIRRDQAELSLRACEPINYPPQPEVEFGFPQTCYCGARPLLATSTSSQHPCRRYYTCENVDDVMEEMRARDRHVFVLDEKVETLSLFRDDETEQKLIRLEKMVCDMAKEKTQSMHGFELLVGVMVLVLVLLVGVLVMVM